MAVVPHPSEKTMLRSSFKWAPGHEFVPVEEMTSSVEQGSVPQGFQELLVRLVKAVLINKPLCIYQCLATTLEAELDRRTLWEMQFSQYSRNMPTSNIASLKVPYHLLPSGMREVGDASDLLPGNPAPRNLMSGLDEQELALVLECFPTSEKNSLDPRRLKPFLAFEFPHGGADATRDEVRVASLSMPQSLSLLAVKAEGLKHLPEDAVSTTASGAIEPVLGELSKDRSAADMNIDSRVRDSGMDNMSPIRPTTEFLLRGHNPFTTDGDHDELQDMLGNWPDNSLKDTSLNEEIDCAGQNKTGKSQTRENSLHMLDTKPTDVESKGSGLASDSSDWPSYIPRGDRLADAMLHLHAKPASVQDLELHEDVAAVASIDLYADALNKIFARYFQEPDRNQSRQDSCIVPTGYDVASTASNPDIAVHATHKQDSNVVQSRNDLADAANTDGRVMHDEPQATYPENSSLCQDVPEYYLKSETEQKCLESVRALEKQEYHSSPYLESAETDELEYVTPPNESFRQSKEEFQEEDEFHTPRATFLDDLVSACDVKMSAMSVHVLRDKLLLASDRSGCGEELTAESEIQEFPQSTESTQNEGVTTESVAEGFPFGKETTHDKEIDDESVIHEFSHNDESTPDEGLTSESVGERFSHGKESLHDKEINDDSVIQELSDSDESSEDEELTTESAVEGVLHGKQSMHDKETYGESMTQDLSDSDESSEDEELTTESAVEGVLHGKESMHDKETYNESTIQEISDSDESSEDEELTTESAVEGVLHGKQSMHDKETYGESMTQDLSDSDESSEDEELTTESAVEGVLHGKESMHDKETYGESMTQYLSDSDESSKDEELTTESVVEGVQHGKESMHDKEINDESVIQELSHSNESTQGEELTTESVVEGDLHGIKSTHDKGINADSVISEIQHNDESIQGKGLKSESVIEEFIHAKEFTNDKETGDESVIQEFPHSDESTQGEELTCESVVEEFPNVKESTHDKDMSDKSLIQEFSPSDEETEGQGLKSNPEFQEFVLSHELPQGEQLISESGFQDFPQNEESPQNKGLTPVSTIQVHSEIEESAPGKKCMSEEFGEFQSSGESAHGEDLKSELAMQDFPQGRESACSNEVIPNSVYGEETTLDSMQAKETVNDSMSSNQMTVSSADETEMQTGSSLEEEMLNESMSGEETKMHASLTGEEMIFESVYDKEMPMDSFIVRKRPEKAVLQEGTHESAFDEENLTLENVKIKMPDAVTLKALPDEEMIDESKLGEEISPERAQTGLKIPDLVYYKYITQESKIREEICEPQNAEMKPPDSVFSKDITPESQLLQAVPIKSEHGEMKVSYSHYSKHITPESLLHEAIQPESENSEVRITDSVYSKDITPESPHGKDTAAKDLQAETQESTESVLETVNPDEEAISVRPVKEPLFYGQNIFSNFSLASESEIPSVANKPTMSEEKTAYMLEWDEMNVDRRESDAILHKQHTSSENTEQDDIFPEKEEREPSLTESESDTGTGQPSPDVAVDHPDCFTNFSLGPSLAREARIRLKWYSISTSCSDVLEEEDEEDESNVTRSRSKFEGEMIQEGAHDSQTLLQDDVSRFSDAILNEVPDENQTQRQQFDYPFGSQEGQFTGYSLVKQDEDVVASGLESTEHQMNLHKSSEESQVETAQASELNQGSSEELAQNQEEESLAFKLTKSELSNEMVSANDLFGKNVSSESKNVSETDAAMFPSVVSRQALTLADDDQNLCKSVEVAESWTNSRVLPENSESPAVEMVTKLSGEDLCSNICEKKSSTNDSLYLSETFTGETGFLGTSMIEKTKEMEDDQCDMEYPILEEPNQIKRAWDSDKGDEIQVDETMASGKHRADENEDEAENAQALEDTKDAQMITEVIDDKFTTVKTEPVEDFSSKTDFIQSMNEAVLKAGRFGEMYTPDEAKETKSMHKTDIDDALCLMETETVGKEMTNTVCTSDMESLEATSGDKYKTDETETNEEDMLRMGATIANFSDEADETSVIDETADKNGMIEIPADEFQSTGMPEIHRDMAENDEDSRALDSTQETDEPELQSILFEPESDMPVENFKLKSTEVIEPEETTSSFESSSNLSRNSPYQNRLANQEGQSDTTEYSPAPFQLVVKDPEEIDTIQEFKKGVDIPDTEVTRLDSHKNQGMPAERDYDETIKPEKAVVFFTAAPGQSNVDSEYPNSDNKTKEESVVESQGEEISPVYPTYIRDAGEAKDEHEHIIMLEEAPIVLAAASVHSHADIDEPNLIDKGDEFFYVEPDRDRQESEPKFLLAHPQLVARDSEEMDAIREIKDYGEYFSSHPCTRSQWEIPFEEDEMIVPQKVDIYSAPPVHMYHDKNDSVSRGKVDFGEETSTGLNTDEKSSCEEDERAVNDQPLFAPENYPTDLFGFPQDVLKTGDETKLNDHLVPSDDSSKSKSCGRKEPLEHEETSSQWPPLPQFLTTFEENNKPTKRSSVCYKDDEWSRMLMFSALNSGGNPASDLPESDGEEEEESIYWTERVKRPVVDRVSLQSSADTGDVAAEVYNNDKPCSTGIGVTLSHDDDGITDFDGMKDRLVSEPWREANDRCDTKNNERLRAFFNAQALEGEDWPPMPDFALFHNESDGMESKNALSEAQSATRTAVGTTEERMNLRDLMTMPENQLMDSSEQWPPLPDFILEELVSGRQKSCLNSEPSTFCSQSQAELPLSSPGVLHTNKPEEFPTVFKQIEVLLRQGRKEMDPFTEEMMYGANSCATDVTEMMPSAWLMSQNDEDEALSEFINEDKCDDQIVDIQLELSVVNRLVLEIVSSAKQSFQELADREHLATFESTPTAREITSELEESALDFRSESPLLLDVLSENQTANSNEFATDLPDSDYEEASIYWTQPTTVKPPVADSVSLQSSPDKSAPETVTENTWKITEPQNNDAGFEVRQFCAVASSAFTDLTKVTGSQGDMKSHHNIQSHIELGIMACQSWSDLDILPCGSSKSLQLIGAPELSSWVAGSDEANRKWREEEQVGRRQVAEADSQSMYTEREPIQKAIETEGVDSGYKVQATEEPLLGCRRDSVCLESEGESHGSSVHIWMPIEEEGLLEETASKGVVAKGSGMMSSPMELREKASEQQSSDVAEAFIALEGTVEPSEAVNAKSNAFLETVPILELDGVEKDDVALGLNNENMNLPCGFKENKLQIKVSSVEETSSDDSVPAEQTVDLDKHTKQTETSAVELRDPTCITASETDLLAFKSSNNLKELRIEIATESENQFSDDSVPAEQTVDLDKHTKQTETSAVELRDPTCITASETDLLAFKSSNNLKELRIEIATESENQFSDDSVPAEQPVDLDKHTKQTETSAVELRDPTCITASETDLLAFKSSNNLKELRTEIATESENQFSAGVPGEPDACAPEMSDVQELPISGHLEAQQEAVIHSAPALDEMTNIQELLISDRREPHQRVDVLNHVSCSLCKTDRVAHSGYPDTAATPLSDPGNWVQMGHTWIFEEEMLTSAEPSGRGNELLRAEEETKCLSSFPSTLMATGEIAVGENRADSPTFEKVKTVDEEVKLDVSTGMDASLTQPASLGTDKIGASSESASTISLKDVNSHLSFSPQVVEVKDSDMGLDEDDWVQDEVDEDVFGVQEHHFLQNESTTGKQMENNMFSDTSKPRIEHHRSLGTISEQLDLIKPDDSPVLRQGDSTKVTQESGLYSTNVSLVDEKVVTEAEESDPSYMQRMPFPVSIGDELSSLTDSFMKLCLRTSPNQLESEAADNSNPSASFPRKGEDEGQQINQEERLIEEDELSVSNSDFPKSLTLELSSVTHCVQDMEPKTESLKWEDSMQDSSTSKIRGENRVAFDDSQTIDSDVKKEADIPRQHEDLGTIQVKDLDKDHDSDPNKDCEEGLNTENENELDNHEWGLDKNLDKDQDKNDNEDQDKNCAKDLDGDYNEDQDTNPDMNQHKDHDENQDKNHDKDHDKDHDENLDKYLDKDCNEDQDMNNIKDLDMGHCKNQDISQGEAYGAEPDTNHNKDWKEDHREDHDLDHEHHIGPVTILNKTDSLEDIGKELGVGEVSATEEQDDYIEPIPPHPTKSETDLVFTLHEIHAEDSDVEPLNKRSTSPMRTAGKDVTIIPVDVLDQSPRSLSPSINPVFLIASQHGVFKIASPEEQDTIRSSITEFETESQKVVEEQNEIEQGLNDDGQKIYFGTTSSKTDDGTFSSKTAEGIAQVTSKSDDETFASKTIEGISILKVDETGASETVGDAVVSSIKDGTRASKAEEGIVLSKFDDLNASKTDDKTDSSEADEGIVASKTAEVESHADDGTTEPFDGVVASEIDIETADDGTVTSEP